MIFQNPNEYGILADLVSGAGSLLAAGGALRLGWRGRLKNWEPSEEDIDRGPQRVGSLLVVVAIAILWTQTRGLEHLHFLNTLAISLLAVTVIALIIYGILTGVFTYDRVIYVSGHTQIKKIVGGFWLTEEARHAKKRARNEDPPRFLKEQDLLKGAAYDADSVWPRLSRSLAKSAFVVFYIMLTASGTIALACASIILGLKTIQ